MLYAGDKSFDESEEEEEDEEDGLLQHPMM
jgi:hypothetical protein